MRIPMKQPVGVILAGGKGMRVGGQDKAFLDLCGEPLVHYCLKRFAPQVTACAISSNNDASRFGSFPAAILPDPIPGRYGPLVGVLAGLDWAADQGADRLATIAVDTPFLPRDLVSKLETVGQNDGVAVAVTPTRRKQPLKSGGGRGYDRHPTCAIWPVSVRTDLRNMLAAGERKMGLFLDRHQAKPVCFQDPVAFLNINRLEDLAQAEAILQASDRSDLRMV